MGEDDSTPMGGDDSTPMDTAGTPADAVPAPEASDAPPPPPAYVPPAYVPPAGYAPPPPVPPAGYAPPPPAPPQPGYAQPYAQTPKDKTVAGLLGILLGAYGAHKFYLGYTTEAIIMLGVSLGSIVLAGGLSWLGIGLCFIPVASAVGIIGMVEGIVYLTKTDQDFYYTYVLNRKPWF